MELNLQLSLLNIFYAHTYAQCFYFFCRSLCVDAKSTNKFLVHLIKKAARFVSS